MVNWSILAFLEQVQEHLAYDGTVSRNLYRNQIDYIIFKNKEKVLCQDSRLYSGTSAPTDYKIVKEIKTWLVEDKATV